LIGCDSSSTYTFNLYLFNNSTSQWTYFSNSSYYFTSGQSNTDFTISKSLFTDYPSQNVWKIELIVNVASTLSTNQTYQGATSMQILVNFSPLSGVCTVNPFYGNTTSLFNIMCNSWKDPDGSVTNYAFYSKLSIENFIL